MPEREYVDFKALKQRISIREVLEHYGLFDRLEPKDENTLVGRCPITESKSETAFKARLDKNIWYSFALEGDGAGGNILDFVARMEDTDILGAANLIAAWFECEDDDPAEESADTTEAPSEDAPGGGGQLDVFTAFEALCADEIDILHSGARSAIKEALSSHQDSDNGEIDAIAKRLSNWILRAYQRGYRLGRMQGRIDERISSLHG